MQEFVFLDPGPLIDDDLALVLVEQHPADPVKNRAAAWPGDRLGHLQPGQLGLAAHLRVGRRGVGRDFCTKMQCN